MPSPEETEVSQILEVTGKPHMWYWSEDLGIVVDRSPCVCCISRNTFVLKGTEVLIFCVGRKTLFSLQTEVLVARQRNGVEWSGME